MGTWASVMKKLDELLEYSWVSEVVGDWSESWILCTRKSTLPFWEPAELNAVHPFIQTRTVWVPNARGQITAPCHSFF